jgi:hypothetical protein
VPTTSGFGSFSGRPAKNAGTKKGRRPSDSINENSSSSRLYLGLLQVHRPLREVAGEQTLLPGSLRRLLRGGHGWQSRRHDKEAHHSQLYHYDNDDYEPSLYRPDWEQDRFE